MRYDSCKVSRRYCVCITKKRETFGLDVVQWRWLHQSRKKVSNLEHPRHFIT